ncbi:autotransporter outer membrane beta-barrel domain-containing protein [Paragemmobacter aquarius]|nr:autotransporter outer membrane beta-barrel domain-containing protein [Gemmobacter aquarius]
MKTITHAQRSDVRGIGAVGRSGTLSALLLGSVCAVSLVAGMSRAAYADQPCVVTGAAQDCSGDLSFGLLIDPGVSALTIHDVTSDIGSVGGVTGLRFDHGGALTVTSNTGAFKTVGQGDDLNAIHLSGFGADASVTLTQTGDVESDDASAVLATATSDVTVTMTGDATGKTDAIKAQSFTDGDVKVDLTGDALSHEGSAIYATAQGSVDVTVTGNVTGKTDAIKAQSFTAGNVTVDLTGDALSYEGSGVYATAQGAVDVTVDGDVTSKLAAITASNFADTGENVSVTTGEGSTLTSWNEAGIVVSSAYGAVSVDSKSNITANKDGINAISSGSLSDGSVTVTQSGDIRSDNGKGIYASSTYHAATVTSTGDIQSNQTGIYVKTTGRDDANADATVNQTGDITSDNGNGIYAESIYHGVDVVSSGAIVAEDDAIFARTTGDDDLTSTLSVKQTGALTSYDAAGVKAVSANKSIVVDVAGSIDAKLAGIDAQSTGNDSQSTVDVTHSGGRISSFDSYGIIAKSSATSVTVTNTSDIISKLDGINATMTGNGDPGKSVTVSQTGDIETYSGYGIYATATEAGVSITNSGDIQSKQGGIYGYATGNEDGASVTIVNTGDIKTFDGKAIYGKSSSRTVSVTQNAGTLDGNGTSEYGIYAEALTETASATVNLGGEIKDMTKVAVYLRGVEGTTLTNRGIISAGVDQLAVQTAGYNGTLVDNYGTISGSVTFSTGESTFNNHEDAVFNVIDAAFDQGGFLNNDGILAPGTLGSDFDIREAHINGRIVQSDTGVMLIDVNATEADKIVVSNNVELDGGLQLNFSEFGDERSIEVLTSYWLDVRNLSLLNTAVDASIRYDNDRNVVLDYVGLNFGASVLSDTTRPVGDSLTAAFDAGSIQMTNLFLSLANIADDAEYQLALDQLTPTIMMAQTEQSQNSAIGFADSLMSCPSDAGAVFAIGQTSCFWGRGSRLTASQTEFGAEKAYDAVDTNQQIGGQFGVTDKLFLGVSFGSTSTELDAGALGNSTQSGTDVGVALKYVDDAWLFAAALSMGNATVDTTRNVLIGDVEETLTSARDISSKNLRLRAAASLGLSETSYLKSILDVNVTQVSSGAATETGGMSALSYAAGDAMIYSVAPSYELGTKVAMGSDVVANPFVRLGVYSQFGSSQDVTGNFALSDAADGSFTTGAEARTLRGTLAVGVNLVKGDFGSLNLLYSRQVGDGVDMDMMSVKGTIRF